MNRPGRIIKPSELTEIYSPKLTARQKMYEYIKNHPKCKVNKLLQFGENRTVRRELIGMVESQLVVKEMCRCGNSAFYSSYDTKRMTEVILTAKHLKRIMTWYAWNKKPTKYDIELYETIKVMQREEEYMEKEEEDDKDVDV